MTYKEIAVESLKASNHPLTPIELRQRICELGLDKELESVGKTPVATLYNIIYTDMKHKGDTSTLIIASKKPTKFSLRNQNLQEEDLPSKNEALKPQKMKFYERDLHLLLVKFLYESPDFKPDCKTIYHEKSAKSESGRDKWNYSVIVGVYFPHIDYKKEILELLNCFNQNSLKLFSFELKINLDFSNLKQSYFQAVSHSSWANEGYLVVFEELDDRLLSELNRLNQSFGIGVIKLEREPSNSRIILNARKRELDAQTINILLEKNPDFKQFINDINNKIKVGLVSSGSKIYDEFDKVLSDEELLQYLKEKL